MELLIRDKIIMEQIKPKDYLNKILKRSFNKPWSKIKKFNYDIVIKNDFFPISGKLVVYGLIEKKQKVELLISSNFSNLNDVEENDDWFSSELSRFLQNHNQWTK